MHANIKGVHDRMCLSLNSGYDRRGGGRGGAWCALCRTDNSILIIQTAQQAARLYILYRCTLYSIHVGNCCQHSLYAGIHSHRFRLASSASFVRLMTAIERDRQKYRQTVNRPNDNIQTVILQDK
jgi:hypothetical protein